MSDFSNYAETKVGDHLLRATASTAPAALYVALYTAVTDAEAATGTELSGGAYARTAVTFGVGSNGVYTNSAAVTFPTATAAWGTVTHFAILDAATAGNAISVIKALATSRTVASGDTLSFAVGQVSFTIA